MKLLTVRCIDCRRSKDFREENVDAILSSIGSSGWNDMAWKKVPELRHGQIWGHCPDHINCELNHDEECDE